MLVKEVGAFDMEDDNPKVRPRFLIDDQVVLFSLIPAFQFECFLLILQVLFHCLNFTIMRESSHHVHSFFFFPSAPWVFTHQNILDPWIDCAHLWAVDKRVWMIRWG